MSLSRSKRNIARRKAYRLARQMGESRESARMRSSPRAVKRDYASESRNARRREAYRLARLAGETRAKARMRSSPERARTLTVRRKHTDKYRQVQRLWPKGVSYTKTAIESDPDSVSDDLRHKVEAPPSNMGSFYRRHINTTGTVSVIATVHITSNEEKITGIDPAGAPYFHVGFSLPSDYVWRLFWDMLFDELIERSHVLRESAHTLIIYDLAIRMYKNE